MLLLKLKYNYKMKEIKLKLSQLQEKSNIKHMEELNLQLEADPKTYIISTLKYVF